MRRMKEFLQEKPSWMGCGRTEFSSAGHSTSQSISSISIYGITMGAHQNMAPSWVARISSNGTAIILFSSTLSKSGVKPNGCGKNMKPGVSWYKSPQMWVELFALVNLAGLAPDILLAHRTNFFRHPTEYIPLVFSVISPLVLAPTLVLLARGRPRSWRLVGHLVGWSSVLIGITGLVLHLESQFFQQWTLASIVYAAPFAAPLAYTGIGLLLLMNRIVDPDTLE